MLRTNPFANFGVRQLKNSSRRMPDLDIIESKLGAIKKYILILKSNLPTVSVDSLEMYAMERLFQLIVDAAIDINTHIITRSDLEPPDDYQGTFAILADNKILPQEFADTISKSVGLRNLLVHGYEKVDKHKALNDISKGIGQYSEYMRHIRDFMEKQPKS